MTLLRLLRRRASTTPAEARHTTAMDRIAAGSDNRAALLRLVRTLTEAAEHDREALAAEARLHEEARAGWRADVARARRREESLSATNAAQRQRIAELEETVRVVCADNARLRGQRDALHPDLAERSDR